MKVYSHLLSVPLNRYPGNGLLLDWFCGSLFTNGPTTFVTPSLSGTPSPKAVPSPLIAIVFRSIIVSKALHHKSDGVNISIDLGKTLRWTVAAKYKEETPDE